MPVGHFTAMTFMALSICVTFALNCTNSLHTVMIRWMLLTFILLILINSATGIVRKIGLGQLPGDFSFRCMGREMFIPCASAVLVTMVLMAAIKLLAWLG